VFGGEDLGFDLFDLPVEGLLGGEGLRLDFESVVLLAHHAEHKGVVLDLLLPNLREFLRLSVRNNPFARGLFMQPPKLLNNQLVQPINVPPQHLILPKHFLASHLRIVLAHKDPLKPFEITLMSCILVGCGILCTKVNRFINLSDINWDVRAGVRDGSGLEEIVGGALCRMCGCTCLGSFFGVIILLIVLCEFA
jgi:hypothetical protein